MIRVDVVGVVNSSCNMVVSDKKNADIRYMRILNVALVTINSIGWFICHLS